MLMAHPHIRDEMRHNSLGAEDWWFGSDLPEHGVWRWEGSATYHDDGDVELRGEWIEMPQDGGTDGPAFNRGRSEGRSDVAAMLRKIVDPEDKNKWNLDGALAEVRKIMARGEP